MADEGCFHDVTGWADETLRLAMALRWRIYLIRRDYWILEDVWTGIIRNQRMSAWCLGAPNENYLEVHHVCSRRARNNSVA